VPQSLWVAELIVSDATKAKLSAKHQLDWRDIRDAIVCTRSLRYTWDNDPVRGIRALAEIVIRGRWCIAILYPVDDPSGDVYALITAYPH
jgi:hypothetical protein